VSLCVSLRLYPLAAFPYVPEVIDGFCAGDYSFRQSKWIEIVDGATLVNCWKIFFKVNILAEKFFCKKAAIFGGRLRLKVCVFGLVLLDLDVLALFCFRSLQCLSGK